MINRVSALLFGVSTYALFFGVFLYAAAFVIDLPVPKTMNGLVTYSITEAMPINDGWIDLPPIKVRKLEEIHLTEPTELARVDLSELRMEWTPIEGAAKYQIQIGHFVDEPSPKSFWFGSIESNTPYVDMKNLIGSHRSAVRTHWQPGRIAGIRIQALSADGTRLATSKSDRRFVIASGLEQ